MQRLLLALGCAGPPAWTGGLVFALGPLRVPGSLMLAKLLNPYLPLVALALLRLRDAPTAGGAAIVGVVLLCALLSSYYLAVIVTVVSATWSLFELGRKTPGRWRFARLVVASSAVAFGAFVVVSLPYLARPEASEPATPLTVARLFAVGETLRQYLASTGRLPLALAAVGVLASVSGVRGARLAARRGLVLAIVGFLLMHESVAIVHGQIVPMPYAVVKASPARFFRLPPRFVVIFGFGTALLAAAACEIAWTRLGRVAGGVVVGAIVTAIVVSRGIHLGGPGFAEFTGASAPMYGELARLTRDDRGPLLELPVVKPIVSALQGGSGVGTEAESMLGSTRHWLPLVAVSPRFSRRIVACSRRRSAGFPTARRSTTSST
jgi:hypothetical protein